VFKSREAQNTGISMGDQRIGSKTRVVGNRPDGKITISGKKSGRSLF